MTGLIQKTNDGKLKDNQPKGVKLFRRKVPVRRKARIGITAESKMTSKGQVTIPAAIRKALGLKNGDRIGFQINNGVVEIQKITAIDRLAMSIGPELRKEFPTPEDFDAYLKANRKKLFEKIYGEI